MVWSASIVATDKRRRELATLHRGANEMRTVNGVRGVRMPRDIRPELALLAVVVGSEAASAAQIFAEG